MTKRDEFGNVVKDTLPTPEESVAISAENVANAESERLTITESEAEEAIENAISEEETVAELGEEEVEEIKANTEEVEVVADNQ